MRVLIDKKVTEKLDRFYAIASYQHPTLDAVTVRKKIRRIKEATRSLAAFPDHHPLARHRQEWIAKGYRDMAIEDFHLAYKQIILPTGEQVVYVADVCYDMEYHD